MHLPGLLKEPGPVEARLRDALGRATARRAYDDNVLPRIRVYDGPRLDYPGAERVTHLGLPVNSLADWFDAACPSPDACLAFNEVDAWSPHLADVLAREMSIDLADTLGAPRAGLEWYSFLGRRGHTPFGLHSDPESSMIFHLGPAPKEGWVFDRETLAQLPNRRQITYDYAEMLPHARHVVLQPGDYLLIPAHTFHIFENVGFAAFLGLTIFPQDVRRELAEIVMRLLPPPPAGHLTDAQARSYVAGAINALASVEESVAVTHGASERRLRSVAWTRRSYVPPAPLDGGELQVAELPIVPSPPGVRPALYAGGRTVSLPTRTDAALVARTVPIGDRLARADLEAALVRALPGEGTAAAAALVDALARCGTVRSASGDPS